MSTFLLRLSPAFFLFFQNFAFANCADSVRVEVQSVQCYGLRNGEIRVDTVFGGVRPFYFSIDGQSFSTNTTFDHLWPGTYTLYVRDDSGCVKNWQVTVPEPEELQVKIFADQDTVVAGEPLRLNAVVAPNGVTLSAIEWRPPTLFGDPASLNQIVSISQTTNFAIEIRTASGCIARDQLTVEVEKANVYFPNIIKPGSNQDAYFTAFAGEGVSRILSLQIYNRGGGIVFEQSNFPPNDPLKGWNGRWQDKPVQTGVYPYRAVVEYLDGQQKQFRGSVTVVN